MTPEDFLAISVDDGTCDFVLLSFNCCYVDGIADKSTDWRTISDLRSHHLSPPLFCSFHLQV